MAWSLVLERLPRDGRMADGDNTVAHRLHSSPKHQENGAVVLTLVRWMTPLEVTEQPMKPTYWSSGQCSANAFTDWSVTWGKTGRKLLEIASWWTHDLWKTAAQWLVFPFPIGPWISTSTCCNITCVGKNYFPGLTPLTPQVLYFSIETRDVDKSSSSFFLSCLSSHFIDPVQLSDY